MNPLYYSILHVGSAMLLVGITFQAFAAPHPERRKMSLMLSGILSLVMLVAGFGLLSKYNLGFPVWIMIKLVCWLGLSAMAGIAFRRPQQVGNLSRITTGLLIVALLMVYLRPFTGN